MKEEDAQRTEVMQFRVTPREKALIEKYAHKQDVTVSQYVRGSLIMEMATIEADVEAMKIVFKTIGKAAKDTLKQRFSRTPAE